MPPTPFRARRPAKVRAVVGVVVLAVAVTGAVVGVGAGVRADADGSEYRLATVTTDHTREVLHEVGVIEPVRQATVSFPASGVVATVDVAVGDPVAVGDVLATLDPTSLERALERSRSALARAELRLERALDGEDVGSAGGASTGIGVARTVAGGVVDIQLASANAPDPDLRAAREAVVAAKRQVDVDQAAADKALADAEVRCTWADDETDGIDEMDGIRTASDPGPGTPDDTDGITACRDALEAVLVAQRAVTASQQVLSDAATALDELLAERAADLDAPPTSPPAPSGADAEPGSGSAPTGPGTGDEPRSGSTPTGPGTGGEPGPASGPTGPGTGDTTRPPSSADLIAYQTAVGAAEADVAVATQAIGQATIVSPIAGTVVSVGLEPGDEVGAASTDQAVAVAGEGGYEVTTTVGVAELPTLEVGQHASVSPDGREVQLDGEIVAIGVAATDGTTGYPVTIALPGAAGAALRHGAIASVAITTAQADDTLVVPTSAVTIDGSTATVTVYDGTTATEVTVEVGAIGSTWTEIRRGVHTGQQVVLADLGQPLPGAATTSNAPDVDAWLPSADGDR